MPLVTQTFSDIINFTRASSATYFDATGTLQTATTDVPRFDYNPSTLAAQGLLIEEARTNLLLYSNEFDNAWWTANGTTVVTPNAGVAPDGTTTAELVTDATGTLTNSLQRSTNIAISNATAYTLTAYIKLGTATDVGIRVRCPGGSASNIGYFAVGQDVGNGWRRVTANITSDTTGALVYFGLADGTFYIWGAQLEAGAFPTSYIPTVASTVTRAADVASVNTLSPWFNISEGAFYTEWIVPSVTVDQNIASLSDTTSSNRYQNYTTVSSNVIVRTAASGVALNNQFGTPVKDAIGKSAFAYGASSTAGSFNGGSVNTTTQTLPASITRLYLGANFAGAAGQAVWLRRFVFYPRKLANAELQAITT